MVRTIILSVWTLVAAACLAPLAVAQAWITEAPCEDYKIECLDSGQVQKRRQYYLSHARVQPSLEQRLSNGVAWDLLVDAPTGIAIPRITWMSDRQGTRTANRLFDAIQGDLLLEYAELEENWRSRIKGSTEALEFPRTRIIGQPLVALTYATPRLVGYVEVRIYTVVRDVMEPWIIGRVLDLKQGTISSIEPCWGSGFYETGGLF